MAGAMVREVQGRDAGETGTDERVSRLVSSNYTRKGRYLERGGKTRNRGKVVGGEIWSGELGYASLSNDGFGVSDT